MWRALSNAESTDIIIIIPPPPAAPPICYCEHVDCAGSPPSFPTIQKLELHHIKEHGASAAAAVGGEDETMAAIFKPTEDALTPAWRRKDANSFEHSWIRWEQAALIAKDIVPVSTHTAHLPLFLYLFILY